MTDRPIWPGEEGDSTRGWVAGPPSAAEAGGDDVTTPAPGSVATPGHHGQIWPTGPAQPAFGQPPAPPWYGPPPFGPPFYGPGPSGEPAVPRLSGPSRRGRAWRSAAAVLVVAAAAVGGAGVSHAVWPSNSSANVAAPQTTTPTTGGEGTDPGSGSSGSGGSPFVFGNGSGGTGSSGTSSGNTAAAGSPSDASTIAAKVAPALVDVNTTLNYQDAEGAGTGIVLTSSGEILTNNHVVDGATKISVTDIGNGKTYGATVVGYDVGHDIAVLQLQDASGLKTVQLATSTTSVGEAVVAIGNAGGTGGMPTDAGGSITALGQSITASDELTGSSEQLSGLIEVNSNVEAGDSGGPLVNAAGQVIGMDTAASSGFAFSSQGNAGFAIPITTAAVVAKDIEAGDASATVHIGSTAFLGVLIDSPDSSPFSGQYTGGGHAAATGIEIGNVVSGGPAQVAGLGSGDTILSLDGQTVTSAAQLTKLLVPYHPGQKVQLGWEDQTGQSHTTTVTLASGPPA